MRQLFFFLLILFSIQAYGQLPPSIKGDVGESIVIAEPGPRQWAGTYQQNGKFGFVFPNDSRQEPIYEEIRSNNDGFIVKKDGLYGIADKKGTLIGKIEFDAIDMDMYRSGNAYIVKKKDSYGSMTTSGKPILSIKYPRILFSDRYNPQSFIQERDGQPRMVTNDGEKVLPQNIDFVALYANVAVVKVNGKFGVFKRGQQIVPFEYDSIYNVTVENSKAPKQATGRSLVFSQQTFSKIVSHLIVKQHGKFGLVDTTGKLVYAPDYEQVSTETNPYLSLGGPYIIQKGQLKGMYFPSNGKRTDIVYDRIYRDGIALILAGKGKMLSAFNRNGEQMFPESYESILDFGNNYFEVGKEGKRGLVDGKGNIAVPIIYSNLQRFYQDGFTSYLQVRDGEKYGVVNFKNQVVIPVEFEFVGIENQFFRVITPKPNQKFGLYDKEGKVIVAAQYDWIGASDTENSKLLIVKKGDFFNFLDANNKLILPEAVSSFGYIHDEEQLLNPYSSTRNHLLYVKDKKGKFGAINEMTGKLVIPMNYDGLMQRFEGDTHTYYSVRKGKKYGLINEKNEVVLPIEYDGISLDFVRGINGTKDGSYGVVVKRNGKMGTVGLKNQVQIPFVYNELQRISGTGLYKGKTGKYYQLINSKNQVLSAGPFDEIANFERVGGWDSGLADEEALSFYNGQMRRLNQNGKFVGNPVAMQPHQGYKTFDELKFALVSALDSKDDGALKDFAAKIAPSAHILYFLKYNSFNRQQLGRVDVAYIRQKYEDDLAEFKQVRWQRENGYDRRSLILVADYTSFKNEGYVGNSRAQDLGFGDRLMERVLRNAIKINGYWISTYFMIRNFEK